jgi:hypothetical protein
MIYHSFASARCAPFTHWHNKKLNQTMKGTIKALSIYFTFIEWNLYFQQRQFIVDSDQVFSLFWPAINQNIRPDKIKCCLSGHGYLKTYCHQTICVTDKFTLLISVIKNIYSWCYLISIHHHKLSITQIYDTPTWEILSPNFTHFCSTYDLWCDSNKAVYFMKKFQPVRKLLPILWMHT